MCGLAGMAGNGIIGVDLKMFRELLHVASLRGEDATGVMIANTHKPLNEYAIVKEKIPSPQFIAKHSSIKQGGCLSTVGGANLFMGHARWGTVGLNNKDNAHPFDTPKLVGMHNGTLEDWEYCWDETGRGRTDSEMMFEDMSKDGILKVLQGLSANSAFAITVYDKTSRKLYLARNHLRTLYMGFNKKAGVMYWASEFYALHMAADRNDIDIHSFYLKPHQLYEVDIDKITMDDTAPWTVTPIIYDAPKKKKKGTAGFTNLSDGSGWVQNHLGVWENTGGY